MPEWALAMEGTCKFGSFELDTRNLSLRKGQSRIRLPVSLLRLLVFFVSHADELVTREQVTACLWQEPQFVDVSNGINTAINRLRAALGDSSARPMYIETVIGAGYRFIAKVDWPETPRGAVREQLAVAPQVSGDAHPVYARSGLEAEESLADMPALQRTELPVVEPGPPAPLVFDPRLEDLPRQSASSKQAFTGRQQLLFAVVAASLLIAAGALLLHRVRSRQNDSLAIPSRTFEQATFDEDTDPVTSASISPDGRLLAFSDRQGLTVRLLSRSYDRLLSLPPSFKVEDVAWQQQGAALLVSGEDVQGHAQVWSVALTSTARMLLENAAHAVASQDGAIAFTRSKGTEVWISDPGQTSPRKIADADGGQFHFLLWAPDGRTLLAEHRKTGAAGDNDSSDRNYRWTTVFFNAQSGKVVSRQENLKLDSAAFMPNGNLLFLQNDDSGTQLRVMELDPEHGDILFPARVVSKFKNQAGTHLSLSSDGKLIGIVLEGSSSEIEYGDLKPGAPALENVRRLRHIAPDNFPHAWTPSGDAVVFESNDLGAYAIYKQKLDGSPAELLARSSANSVLPKVTPDGKWVLFEEFRYIPSSVLQSILRVPLQGGRVETVPTQGKLEGFDCSTSAQGRCVLRVWTGNRLAYYDLDPVRGQGKELAQTGWTETAVGDWSVSSDGQQVLTVTHDPGKPGIRIIELGSKPQMPREVPVPNFGDLLGVCEATDGKGYLVSAKVSGTNALLLVDPKGHAMVLREQFFPIWGVPSRTGKVAFDAPTKSVNVWLSK